MSLELYRRGKTWHYRGTVGPTGNRKRLRGSTHTKDKDTASRQIADIEKRYWDGHHLGPSAILTFDQACTQFLADGKPFMVGAVDAVQVARDHFKGKLVKDIKSNAVRAFANEVWWRPASTPSTTCSSS